MKQTFVSHTAHADRSADIRKQRLMREAGLEDRDVTVSPLHLSFLVGVVVALLGFATGLMDDGNFGAQVANSDHKVIVNR